MLDIQLEYRKGILFIRLFGVLTDETLVKFNNEVKEVIIRAGIKYVVLNVQNLTNINKEGIKQIRELKKIINKTNGEFFLFGGSIKELKKLVNLENELKVFGKVVI